MVKRTLALIFILGAEALAREARQVTASSLNVRSGPGTGYSILGVANSSQKYVVISASGGWIKIWWAGNTGWIYAAYTQVAAATEIEVTASTLNVRSGASMSYPIVGTASLGQIYVQLAESGGWRQIWFGGAARWVSSAYTKVHTDVGGQRYAPTASELDLFQRTVMAEAGGEPYEGQVAVAAVILNRIASPDFPNTMNGVLYQPYQFEAVSTGYIWKITVSQGVKDACQAALRWSDPSRGALYYFAWQKVWPSWADTKTYLVTIGGHRFYR